MKKLIQSKIIIKYNMISKKLSKKICQKKIKHKFNLDKVKMNVKNQKNKKKMILIKLKLR